MSNVKRICPSCGQEVTAAPDRSVPELVADTSMAPFDIHRELAGHVKGFLDAAGGPITTVDLAMGLLGCFTKEEYKADPHRKRLVKLLLDLAGKQHQLIKGYVARGPEQPGTGYLRGRRVRPWIWFSPEALIVQDGD